MPVSPAPAETTIKATPSGKPPGFMIPYPLVWLAIAAFVVYIPAISFGYTELDDSIFIRDFHDYNEHLSNLFSAFGRGLFDAVKDPYYRPLFSDAMILNFQLSGEHILSYHFINLLLHITSVLLVFKLFRKLELKELHAFILALVFAVHPVLSQAVAWIPGRNDTMLAVFVLSFFLYSIDYSSKGRPGALLLSALFLLLAFFTKETAVFAPPAAMLLLVIWLHKAWNDKRNILQYAVWAGCFLVWMAARSMATTQPTGIASATAMNDALHRLPVIIQYIGKIFLPFNLSVFPTVQDTVYYYGIIAIVVLVLSIVLYKKRDLHVILGGLCVFFLFLMPALLVPANLNQQSFEHRLYLPIIGILLLLPQTILFNNKLAGKQLLITSVVICGILAAVNFSHQKSFADPVSFWSQAAETSPNSAYANMMLAARLDNSELPRSEALFRKAYRLNPREKYLNFYMAQMLQKKDSVAASEPYLLTEKSISNYYQCDFFLARVAMEKKDLNKAITYLQSYLKRDTHNPMANNNLLLLYVQTQQMDKARDQVKQMRQLGLDPPGVIVKQLGM